MDLDFKFPFYKRLISFLFMKQFAKYQIPIFLFWKKCFHKYLSHSNTLFLTWHYDHSPRILRPLTASPSGWPGLTDNQVWWTSQSGLSRGSPKPAAEQESGSHSLYTVWPPTPTPTDTLCQPLYVSSLGVAFWHYRQKAIYLPQLTIMWSSDHANFYS